MMEGWICVAVVSPATTLATQEQEGEEESPLRQLPHGDKEA
jgi:hypothetical protein